MNIAHQPVDLVRAQGTLERGHSVLSVRNYVFELRGRRTTSKDEATRNTALVAKIRNRKDVNPTLVIVTLQKTSTFSRYSPRKGLTCANLLVEMQSLGRSRQTNAAENPLEQKKINKGIAVGAAYPRSASVKPSTFVISMTLDLEFAESAGLQHIQPTRFCGNSGS